MTGRAKETDPKQVQDMSRQEDVRRRVSEVDTVDGFQAREGSTHV